MKLQFGEKKLSGRRQERLGLRRSSEINTYSHPYKFVKNLLKRVNISVQSKKILFSRLYIDLVSIQKEIGETKIHHRSPKSQIFGVRHQNHRPQILPAAIALPCDFFFQFLSRQKSKKLFFEKIIKKMFMKKTTKNRLVACAINSLNITPGIWTVRRL